MRHELKLGALRTAVTVAVLTVSLSCARAQQAPAALSGAVVDEDGHPVSRVEVTAKWGIKSSFTIYTDAAGKFEIAPIGDQQVFLELSKPGFFRISSKPYQLSPGVNDVSFTLYHETELQQTLEVLSGPTQIDPDTTSHQETLVQHEIVNIPVPSSHDLQQSLITMPNVLLDTAGRVHVTGARQGQTEILLDGFEINDPANGSFTPRLNVDAVQQATVETGGYSPQYAHAGAGVLMLDTNAGDDKWRFGATNFIPGFSLDQGVHFGNWYPRVTYSGPIKKGRAWFSEALSLQHSFTVVYGLPSGQNYATQWAGDNLLRAQVNLTPRNVLQASFLFNRLAAPQTGLGPLTPLSTTTDQQSRRYFFSLKDQIWLGHTLIELGGAGDLDRSTSTPQGNATYVVTPSISAGNYFQSQRGASSRWQAIANVFSGSHNLAGKHTLSAGWNFDSLEYSQVAARSQINFLRADGTLSDLVTFTGPASPHVSNTQIGGYAQDLWRPIKPVVFSAGFRVDWDRLIGQALVQPRLAMNWVPAEDGRMKFTLAWAEHYQPINLTIIGQGFDQQRIDTFYDLTGLVALGNPMVSRFVVPTTGLSQPRSYNMTAEWDEKIFNGSFIGAAYLLREGRDAFAWETEPSGIFLLQNNRNDRFVSGEVWFRHAFGDNADVLVDYTRSRANSNEVLDPSIASLIFSPQEPGPLAWDAPNRLISRGWTPLPVWKLLFSYFFEYHTGFPYSAINEEQQLVGPANSLRFPSYASLNIGLEKQFRFHRREWAVRGSVVNLTGHNNPVAVVNNVDAPNYGAFSGGRGVSFTGRLRLVTQH